MPRNRDNYWDKHWTDYTLAVAFWILGILFAVSVVGLIGALAGWW